MLYIYKMVYFLLLYLLIRNEIEHKVLDHSHYLKMIVILYMNKKYCDIL